MHRRHRDINTAMSSRARVSPEIATRSGRYLCLAVRSMVSAEATVGDFLARARRAEQSMRLACEGPVAECLRTSSV